MRHSLSVIVLVAATLAGCSGGGGGGGGNDAPIATDDAATTTEETAVVVDVLANDDDAADLVIVGFTNGTNGATSLSAAGTVTYLPDAGFTGTDTFTYEISKGGDKTGSATVTITVEPIADFEELPEPNDGGPDEVAGEFDVPALGAGPVVLRGCIDPYIDADDSGDEDDDFDAWLITATEPSVVEILVDGKGGLSGGFVVLAVGTSLDATGWIRFGIDLDSDDASRQVYLPTAGEYGLLVTDARTLTLGTPAGSPDACYLASVSRVAEPAPIAGTLGAPMAIPAGDVPAFVDFVPSGVDQTLQVAHLIDGDSSAVQSSVLAILDDVPVEFGTSNFTVAVLATSESLRLVVEPTYDFTLEPREVTLHVTIAP